MNQWNRRHMKPDFPYSLAQDHLFTVCIVLFHELDFESIAQPVLVLLTDFQFPSMFSQNTVCHLHLSKEAFCLTEFFFFLSAKAVYI